MPLCLDTPLAEFGPISAKRAETLEKAGVATVEDLLRIPPMRYEDRTNFKQIRDLQVDEEAVLQGSVAAVGSYTSSVKRFSIFEIRLSDGSGQLPVKFFNQRFLEKQLTVGKQLVLYGSAKFDEYSGRLAMMNPEYEIVAQAGGESVHAGRIVPVYRKLGALGAKAQRQMIFQALESLSQEGEDPLPPEAVSKYGFPPRMESFRRLHFPACPDRRPRAEFMQDLAQRKDPSQLRFLYEELYGFQVGLQLVRDDRDRLSKKRRVVIDDAVRQVMRQVLPFRLTAAQERVLEEIVADLSRPQVMSRLLQGDVGSGKTIVAALAMLAMAENGCQSALMAPTEILAEQHFKSLTGLLEGKTDHGIELLTGSVKAKARREARERIAQGRSCLAVGTHALIQGGVEFQELGLAIIDEQHRFGVAQRSELMAKGDRPDVLVMTATPIPRSLALTVYGDLDLSVIDELPPGRKPVQTLLQTEKRRPKVYEALRRQLAQGRQIYIVYPLVEESEKVDLKAASDMARRMSQEVFPDFAVGLLHGRLKGAEKDQLMSAFAAGEIRVLVATTVIEVGIDVPNATVMVIENAERFGLSQLHQLRGRVGRGAEASYCILMVSGSVTRESFERLQTMRRTCDGFEIAEKDLEIRGPGDFAGTRQSGLPEFRFANIARDRRWLELARSDARDFVRDRRQAADPESDRALQRIAQAWQRRYGLLEVG